LIESYEGRAEFKPSLYYLLALSYHKNGDQLRAYSNIEKCLMNLDDLNLYEKDESGYAPLTEEKIISLRDKIIQTNN
jgi:hypothetical protein